MIWNFFTELVRQFAAASDSITAVAAIFAAIFAYVGVRTWRQQLKGSAEYALAKEVLKAAYRVREAFKHVRNPAIFAFEYPESMREESGHLKKDFQVEGTTHVYEERFKILNEAFRQLEEKTLDAQVEWGADFAEVIVPLRKCRVELQITLQDYFESLKPQYGRRTTTASEKPSELDSFTPEINSAIDVFESRLRPIIGKKKNRRAKLSN